MDKNCNDCGAIIRISSDMQNGEIVTCSCCGLEYEFQNGELSELQLEGEDWGE